ncbi:MAG: hypothetical protein M3Y56_12285, partial [Armatimonadota bacterium]|nr:hypothetical protein [Armatimonadota bacterium]
MEREGVEYVVHHLNQAGVRYLVVGGLAVVAHGYTRFTADVDLVVDLENDNLQRAIQAFSDLGYRPRAPVGLEQFADAMTRALWIEEKGLTVLSLFSPQHPWTEVDLFVEAPFDFGRAYASAANLEIARGLVAPFVSLHD